MAKRLGRHMAGHPEMKDLRRVTRLLDGSGLIAAIRVGEGRERSRSRPNFSLRIIAEASETFWVEVNLPDLARRLELRAKEGRAPELRKLLLEKAG